VSSSNARAEPAHEEPSQGTNNDKTTNSEKARKKVLKLLLVSWIISLV